VIAGRWITFGSASGRGRRHRHRRELRRRHVAVHAAERFHQLLDRVRAEVVVLARRGLHVLPELVDDRDVRRLSEQRREDRVAARVGDGPTSRRRRPREHALDRRLRVLLAGAGLGDVEEVERAVVALRRDVAPRADDEPSASAAWAAKIGTGRTAVARS
jgi:hypothetical protein